MSNDEPIIRPNLMHVDASKAGHGMGHGGGGCGCGGHGGSGHGHGHGEGKSEGGCGCGGHDHANRDFVVNESTAGAEKVTQTQASA